MQTIRGVMGVCHLLVDATGDAVLLDTGLIGEPWQIRWRLRQRGLGPQNVKAILLTHGHIDHAGNLAWAKAWTGAPIYAHPAEQAHIDGTYPYTGINRWCGRLERRGARGAAASASRRRSTCRSRTATNCRSGAGCASCTCPATRSGTAVSTARGTTCCSAGICSRVIFSARICRRDS